MQDFQHRAAPKIESDTPLRPNHLQIRPLPERICPVATIDRGGFQLRVYNVPHLIALQCLREADDVVGARVRKDDDVDSPGPPRQMLGKTLLQHSPVGAAIDEHPSARG